MLNRRILRVKAFKAVYSRVENPAMTLPELEAELERSCEATRDLYLFLMALCAPLTAEALSRIEASRSKFNPTQEELNPNMKFVQNGIAPLLDSDPDFGRIIKKKKISWDNCDVFLRHLYENVRSRSWFSSYLSSEERSIRSDAGLFVKIFTHELPDNPELEDILEEKSMYWTDELEYAINWCCRSLEEIGDGGQWSYPELFLSDMPGIEGKESDKAFVLGIVRTAWRNFDKYYAAVTAVTPKWDGGRICATDLALIISGLAEADAFSNIDYHITINEFVEISKYYSTPESRAFVNGVLDKLINKK